MTGKRKIFKDLSANFVQTLLTQLFGLIIFYLTSKYLAKEVFGEFNWSMALGSTILAISSFGLDLVFVKRIAAGENRKLISGLHFFHNLAAGGLLILLLAGVHFFVPVFTYKHPLFFFVFISLALANIANSLKLYLNGLESYKQLALLALFANAIKLGLIFVLFMIGRFTITTLIYSYMIASLLEFCLAYSFIKTAAAHGIKPLLHRQEYRQFILQSLPQLGVVIFDSALARIDWIILGILAGATATAEYSFAYKVFELSKLPLLIIAPVLLTRFSKLFNQKDPMLDKYKHEIQLFLKTEMFVIMFIPIVLVSSWVPLIDFFTDNKYGAVNEVNYSILALCIPLHGIINFLWTLAFVQGQLKVILYITVTTSSINIISNFIFIPLYGTIGASAAFLICTVVQLLLYTKFTRQEQIKPSVKNIGIAFFSAVISVTITKACINNIIFATLAAVCIYIAISLITKQIRIKQILQIIYPDKPERS